MPAKKMKLMIPMLLPMFQYQMTLMPEVNGHHVFMQSETKDHVVHAGLSVHLKPYQTDSVLHQMEPLTKSFPHKTWYLVTRPILDVMEVTLPLLGDTLQNKVLSLMIASHMDHHQVQHQHAHKNAQEPQLLHTSARQDQLFIPSLLLMLKLKFMLMDQLKVLSQYMLIS